MGAVRDRTVREMSLREFSASTQKLYLATLTDLAEYHHQSPDTLDPTQVQSFLLYLTQERHLAWSAVSARPCHEVAFIGFTGALNDGSSRG